MELVNLTRYPIQAQPFGELQDRGHVRRRVVAVTDED